MQEEGLRRLRRGRGFAYLTPRGKRLRDAAELTRIRALAIPPAWTEVRICPTASGSLQAIGYDARARLQYLYHATFRARRDADKYARLCKFVEVLPAIRRRVRADLKRPGLSRDTVLAAAVRLLDRGHLRIGNDAYARDNDSFGLTTLRNRHASVQGEMVRLSFRGKSGIEQEIEIRDRRVARVVRQCLKLPGRDLLQYLDEEGNTRDVTASLVNAYLSEISGQTVTAKDFRTWGGTVLALRELIDRPAPTSEHHARREISQAIGAVTKRLRNTKAVCRKSYIHPLVLDAYQSGELEQLCRSARVTRELSRHEVSLCALLRKGHSRRKRSA